MAGSKSKTQTRLSKNNLSMIKITIYAAACHYLVNKLLLLFKTS